MLKEAELIILNWTRSIVSKVDTATIFFRKMRGIYVHAAFAPTTGILHWYDRFRWISTTITGRCPRNRTRAIYYWQNKTHDASNALASISTLSKCLSNEDIEILFAMSVLLCTILLYFEWCTWIQSLSVYVPLSIIFDGVPVLSFTFLNTGLLVSISESTGETDCGENSATSWDSNGWIGDDFPPNLSSSCLLLPLRRIVSSIADYIWCCIRWKSVIKFLHHSDHLR